MLREDPQSSSGEVGEPPTPTEELRPTPTQGQKTAKKTKLSTRPQYYNPEPVARMFGRTNEAKIEVNGIPTTCLVDTGATVTIVNAEFCEKLGLEVHSIEGLITVSATGGTNIPYLGYTVATIEFPQIPSYSDEVVMLVISVRISTPFSAMLHNVTCCYYSSIPVTNELYLASRESKSFLISGG